jgi:prepilin-type N-terminal cleavage/methylation domain-containing protein
VSASTGKETTFLDELPAGYGRLQRLTENIKMRTTVRKRAGFTLVELVVVIMIIGILAAIAAPKIFSTSQTATQNAARANLRVVRDALDTYAASNNGSYPASLTTTPNPLAPYLRGGVIPNCPVGANAGTATIATGTGTATAPPATTGTSAYMYDSTNGWFIINDTSGAYSSY